MELPEGVANSDNLLASDNSFRVAKFDRRKVRDVVNLQKCDVVERVGSDGCDVVVGCTVVEDDLNLVCAVDDVFVGQNIAVFSNNHAGASGGRSRGLTEETSGIDFGNDRDDARRNFAGNVGN